MNLPADTHAALPKQVAIGSPDDLTWLPAVNPAHVEILNLFQRDGTRMQLNIAGIDIGLQLADLGSSIVNPVIVPLAIGPWACRLVLSAGTLERLLQGLGMTRMIAKLAPRQRSILLEYILTEQLDRLEEKIGYPLRFGEQEPTADYDITLPWIIDFDDFPRNAELHLNEAAARAIGQAVTRHAPNDNDLVVSSLLFPVQLCAGTQQVSVSELDGLQLGDVILGSEPAEADPFAVLSGRFLASARPDGTNYRLNSEWSPLERNWGYSMTSQTRSDSTTTSDEIDPLEGLPVHLVFEIGRCELPLSEIRKLGKGSIVPAAPGTANAVKILANGRLVGSGELVKIGAGLGVRVLRLSKNG
ncbi:MAG: type III secretion system cytoplasmic ring protein SctQ [Phyllobacterium sp.]